MLALQSLTASGPELATAQSASGANGHLVLRDKNGAAVSAAVNVSCAPANPACGTFRKVEDFPCVWLQFLDDRTVGVTYTLQTGQIDECEPNFANWQDDPAAYFLDDSCQGASYAIDSGSGLTRLVNGQSYAPTARTTTTKLYHWNNQDNTCDTLDLGGETVQVWKFERLPNWVEAALPNPPYTLSMEY